MLALVSDWSLLLDAIVITSYCHRNMDKIYTNVQMNVEVLARGESGRVPLMKAIEQERTHIL